MWLRYLLAGVLGGAVVFFAGFVEHTKLQWVDRHMKSVPQEAALQQTLREKPLPAGLYVFPWFDGTNSPPAEQEAKLKELNEKWKKGPSGMLIVANPGEDMMGPKQLVGEFLVSVVASFAAAAVVLQLSPRSSFIARWRVVLLMGAFSWFSINASYFLWYGFPWEAVRDEFFCMLFEWGLAGLVIAALVSPVNSATPSAQ